jgi:hypothetical protein
METIVHSYFNATSLRSCSSLYSNRSVVEFFSTVFEVFAAKASAHLHQSPTLKITFNNSRQQCLKC